jgi:hypothetical protein
MRRSPTLGYLALLGIVLVGCAAGDDEPKDLPPIEAPVREKKEVDATKPAPAFEPSFNGTSGTPDSKKDPAPANADQCIDNGDPGGAENVATKLPDTDDCDDDMKTLTGIAKGAVDVDFYKLSATDHGVSFNHPFGCKLDTDFEAETAGTELCVYARCKNSTADAVTGCEAGAIATSEIGMKGCCAAAPGRAVPKWDCSGFGDDDSADFFLRVRQINGEKCLPYKVKYRF